MLIDTPPVREETAPKSRFSALFGGLPRQFWIIAGGTVANRLGAMVVPFLVFFLGSRGLGEEQTGVVVAFLGVGGLAGSLFGGWLTDRIGPRAALLTGLVAAPATLGFLYVVPSVPLLTFAALTVGAAGRLYPPAANALIAASVTGERRVRAYSLFHWALNIGTAGAASLAGFLAVHGYALIFALDIATCLVFAGIAALGIPRTSAPRRPSDVENAGDRGGYGVVLRDRLMLVFLVVSFAGEIVYSFTEFAVPLSIRQDGLSPAVFGAVAVVNAVLVVVLQPVLYRRVVRFGRFRVNAVAGVVIGIGVAGTGLAHDVWMYVATTVVWSVGEVVGGIVYGGIAADMAPAEAQGRYQGAFTLMSALSRLVGPGLTTVLFATAGPAVLWIGAAVSTLVCAFVLIRLEPRFLRRIEAAA